MQIFSLYSITSPFFYILYVKILFYYNIIYNLKALCSVELKTIKIFNENTITLFSNAYAHHRTYCYFAKCLFLCVALARGLARNADVY